MSLLVILQDINMPMQYSASFTAMKYGNVQLKKCDVFRTFCPKYRLRAHARTASF